MKSLMELRRAHLEEIKKIPLISTFIGACSFLAALFAIFQSSNEHIEFALIFTLFIASATSLLFGRYYNKYKILKVKFDKEINHSNKNTELLEDLSKELSMFDENFNELMDITKQVVTNMIRTHPESIDEFTWGVRQVLDSCATYFTDIKKKKCVASIMIRQSDGCYVTAIYSGNVPYKRSEEESSRLSDGKGYVSRAFRYKRPQLWNLEENDPYFEVIRSDHEKYYCSGISVPIFVFGEKQAVLNVDCEHVNGMNEYDLNLASGYGFALGIILVSGNDSFKELHLEHLR